MHGQRVAQDARVMDKSTPILQRTIAGGQREAGGEEERKQLTGRRLLVDLRTCAEAIGHVLVLPSHKSALNTS
eukprot:2048340-Rhodomonas_salina.1